MEKLRRGTGGVAPCGLTEGVIVIRRRVDRHRAYTAIFLKGEPAQIFPTTDYEHARILQIYLQDRPHAGIHNDHTDYSFGKPPASQAPRIGGPAEQA